MNAPRCSDEDYIQFLIASPRMVSATEAARAQSPRAASCIALNPIPARCGGKWDGR